MEYKAIAKVDGGISHGIGSNYPYESNENKKFDAHSDQEAFMFSLDWIIKRSRNVILNPDTQVAKVTLCSLQSDQSNVALDQKAVEEFLNYFRSHEDFEQKWQDYQDLEISKGGIIAKQSLYQRITQDLEVLETSG